MRAATVELDLLSGNISPPPRVHGRTWMYVVEAKAGLLPVEEAIRLVQEQIDDSIECGITGTLAPYYHTMGLLMLQGGGGELDRDAQGSAEKYFRKSIDTACSQSARSFELRASIDLARLWQRQGKNVQARKILSSIYGWFKEGLDTPDLKDARAMIAALR